MNKKGFSLVELLVVIVLLGIIMTLAIPAITGITRSIKDNMLEKKVELIEQDALLYGEEMKMSIINSTTKYNGYKCKVVVVKDLVPEYLDKDNEDCTIGTNCIIDPSDENNYLDNYNIILYYKNKRLKAKLDIEGKLSCS